jgi:hypothetical protein
MFPNVRWLIAATLASVVALIFGFGMFAAVRISSEPLVRVIPVAAAPLPPLADGVTAQPLAFAAEPFDRRFPAAEPLRGEAIEAMTRMLAHREVAEPSSPALAAPDQAAAIETKPSAAVEAPKDAAVPSGTEPSGQPAADIATPAASDDAPVASLPDHVPPAVDNIVVPAVSPPAATEARPVEAPSVTAVVPPAEPAKPELDATPAKLVEPGAVPQKPESTTENTTPQPHATAKAQRPRRTPGATAKPDTTFQQTNFLSAPAPEQAELKARRAKVASKKPKEPDSGTGGPLVSAPGP